MIMSVDRTILNLSNDIVKSKKRDIVEKKYINYLYEEFKEFNYYQEK